MAVGIIAALLGMGLNIGLSKMAEATPRLTYKQLANVSQWCMYEDAMNKAKAVLVNFHHKLQLSSYWGDGTTSSSDGMRMQLGVSSLHADANPHYGTGKGARVINSLLTTQKLFILIQGMQFMFWMVYYTMRQI